MTEETQPRPDLLDQAVRVADRWVAEDRYRWHVYHTNVRHLALMRLGDVTGMSRYAHHVAEAHRYYCTELSAELLDALPEDYPHRSSVEGLLADFVDVLVRSMTCTDTAH